MERDETAGRVREEVADIFIYLLRLAYLLGVELDHAVAVKLEINVEKYPVEQSRSSARPHDTES